LICKPQMYIGLQVQLQKDGSDSTRQNWIESSGLEVTKYESSQNRAIIWSRK